MPTRPVTSSGSSVPSTALIFVSVKATGPVPGIPVPPARRAKAYTTLTAFGRKVHSTRSGLRSTGGPATTGTVTADTGAHL